LVAFLVAVVVVLLLALVELACMVEAAVWLLVQQEKVCGEVMVA
jgi:hypothetical protein